MSPVLSAGIRMPVSHDWFSFYFGLVKEVARFFNQSVSVGMQNQSNCGITFDTQLKSALNQSELKANTCN